MIGASLGLCAVFHEDEAMAAAYVAQTVCVCHAPVKVHYHDALGARRYMALHQINVHFQIVEGGFDEHRCETIVGYGDDGGYVSVCRYDDFIAIVEDAYFLICAYDKAQRIQSVGHGDAVLCACVSRIVGFKAVCLLALQIPSAIDHSACCLQIFIAVHLGDSFKVELLYHDMSFSLGCGVDAVDAMTLLHEAFASWRDKVTKKYWAMCLFLCLKICFASKCCSKQE